MIRIKEKVISDFLKKVRMENVQLIDEAIFRFEEEGLKVGAISTAMQASVNAFLKKEAFIEYEALGPIPLNDLKNVKSILKRFTEITIEKEGNVLIVSQGPKNVEIPLIDERFITNEKENPNLSYTDEFSLSAEQINAFIEDARINKNCQITIETRPGKVILTNNGKYKFKAEYESENCIGGVRATFGDPLIDAITNLTGNLKFKVATDYPANIISEEENLSINVIVAPYVEKEE